MAKGVIAEFTAPVLNFSLSGYITRISKKEVGVEFLPVKEDLAPLLSQRVDVLFALKGGLRRLETRLVKIKESRAVLEICAAPRKALLRQHVRHACCVPVQFRPMREDGVKGVWKEGCSLDIGLGGICFEMRASAYSIGKGEVLINLSQMWLDAIWRKKAHANNGAGGTQRRGLDEQQKVESKPLHLRGAVCYTRPTERGTVIVGLKFTDAFTAENLRLARILLDVFH